MAVSDNMFGILAALAIIYWFFIHGKRERWKKLMGGTAFPLFGTLLIFVADSIVMYSLFLMTLLIGGITLFETVVTWTK